VKAQFSVAHTMEPEDKKTSQAASSEAIPTHVDAPAAAEKKKPTPEEIEARKRAADELRQKRAAEQRDKQASEKNKKKEAAPQGPAAAAAPAASSEGEVSTFNFPKTREGFAAWYDHIMDFAGRFFSLSVMILYCTPHFST